MGLLDPIKKTATSLGKAVKKNKALKTAVVGAAIAGGTSVGGPVGGIVAGSVASSVLKGGKTKSQKAKASKAATASHGSTEIAMRENAPPKGIFALLAALFGG